MRVRLTLTALQKAAELPLDYQYAVASLLYNALGRASEEFATRLHGEGFSAGGRTFRLFTFSRLATRGASASGGHLLLTDPSVSLQVGSPVADFVEHLVTGLSRGGVLRLAGTPFRLESAELVPQPPFTRRMSFRALSPVTESVDEGGRHPRFLDPEDDWSEIIRHNLLRKHRALYAEEPQETSLSWEWDRRYLADARERGRRTSVLAEVRGVKVRGWLLPFTVEGGVGLMRMGYEAGFGSRNSMGFGMAEATSERGGS